MSHNKYVTEKKKKLKTVVNFRHQFAKMLLYLIIVLLLLKNFIYIISQGNYPVPGYITQPSHHSYISCIFRICLMFSYIFSVYSIIPIYFYIDYLKNQTCQKLWKKNNSFYEFCIPWMHIDCCNNDMFIFLHYLTLLFWFEMFYHFHFSSHS